MADQPHTSLSNLADLSPAERRVADLMAKGLSNRGIADRLVVTERAVEKRMQDVLWKLTGLLHDTKPEVNRRVLAVLAYWEAARG